jgi:hypothetical protein
MTVSEKFSKIQTRPATEVEQFPRLASTNRFMNPGCLRCDCILSAAGEIVFLREVLAEHPSAELRLVPRDFILSAPKRIVYLNMLKLKYCP